LSRAHNLWKASQEGKTVQLARANACGDADSADGIPGSALFDKAETMSRVRYVVRRLPQ